MSYIETTLRPGEALTRRGHLHRILLLPGALWLLAGLSVAAAAGLAPEATLMAYGLGALLGGWGVLRLAGALLAHWTTEYAVTSLRVVIKTGWIRRNATSLPGARIESVEVSQSVLGRLLDYGTVTVRGTGENTLALPLLAEPLAFRDAVMDILRDADGEA